MDGDSERDREREKGRKKERRENTRKSTTNKYIDMWMQTQTRKQVISLEIPMNEGALLI